MGASSSVFPRAALWGAATLVALVLVAVGYVLGHGASGVDWRVGSAHVGSGMATIDGGEWQYGLSRSVAWIDSAGSQHEDGWPECLDVPVGTTVHGVRFATVDVDADGQGWREVVLVDCQ